MILQHLILFDLKGLFLLMLQKWFTKCGWNLGYSVLTYCLLNLLLLVWYCLIICFYICLLCWLLGSWFSMHVILSEWGNNVHCLNAAKCFTMQIVQLAAVFNALVCACKMLSVISHALGKLKCPTFKMSLTYDWHFACI